MRKAILGLSVLALGLSLSGCFWVRPEPSWSPVGKKILLPLYIYPSWWDENLYRWDEVASARTKAEIWAIINPASGPDGPPNSDYQRGMADLRAAGVTMLGYVWTNYGNKPIEDVKGEIDIYAEHFVPHGLSGIFLDGVSSSADQLPYYADLQAYAQGKGLSPLVLNPGTTIAEEYLAQEIGDVIVIYEDRYENFLSHTLPDYVGRYPPERFAVLIWGVPGIAEAREVLRRAQGIGFFHCTEDTPPNEWDTLPSFWEEWVELFQKPLYYVP